MEAERWRRLSPLLDALLEQEAPLRAESLAGLRAEDPKLADELEDLLRLEENSDSFLSDPLVPPMLGWHRGSVVGPYRLERMLGEGGMGQVWLAQRDDGLYQRRVALKLLRPGIADPNLRLRFTRERQILARLEHPHIARLLDAGISGDGQPYLALEYVDGEPLTDWCQAHEITVDARLRLFQQVCRALSHAHANLIVHRDLKPSNILVTPLGEVRLLDFGIAKLLDSADLAPDHTRTGVRAFTLHYAAPEQLRGEPVTTMTDVYSLGMVLFELLADSRPYRLKRQSDAEWEDAILHADPQRPSLSLQRGAEGEADRDRAQAMRKRARMLSGDLDNIVLKALAKQPEQRYASVDAIAQDVQRYRDGKAVLARPQGVGYRFGKYLTRHRWPLATAALITLVMVSALGIVAWQARNAMQQANRAQAMQAFVIGLIEQAGNATSTGQVDLPRLLDTGVQRIDQELAQQPATRAELYGVIAQLRLGLGDYRQAGALLQRQAQLIGTLSDPPPTLVLGASTGLGRVRRLQGQPQVCVDAMQAHVDLARRQQRHAPMPVADFYSELGRCQRGVGQAESAHALFQQALKLRREVPDAAAATAAVESLADLAQLHSGAGDTARALHDYRGALRELRNKAGMRHPLAIDLERIICALERHQGRLQQAEPHCDRALALGMALYGAQHRATIDARRQLAAVHVDQGRFAQAESEFLQSRRWLISRLGGNHTDVSRDDNSLAIVAWEMGRTREAMALFDHGLAILRKAPKPNSLADVMFNKAMVLHASGADRQALPLLVEVRRLRLASLRDGHPLIGDTDRLMGEVQAALGADAAAASALSSGVKLTRAGYGSGHPHTYRALISQARFHALDAGSPDPGALRTLDAMARIPGTDAESAKLRWRARTYAAEARCRQPAGRADAVAALQAVRAELEQALPEAGEFVREVQAIQARCSSVG